MSNVSELIRESLELYVNKGIPPGGFLKAVLANDLMYSMAKADDFNRHNLFYIVEYIYNEIPANCYGDYETVSNWIKDGGLGK